MEFFMTFINQKTEAEGRCILHKRNTRFGIVVIWPIKKIISLPFAKSYWNGLYRDRAWYNRHGIKFIHPRRASRS